MDGRACADCDGRGYVTGHDPGCWGGSSCNRLCPVQIQCQPCRGEGVIYPPPRLLPMTWTLGDFVLHHGERGSDEDPDHPEACFCGIDPYWTCEKYAQGDAMGGLILAPADEPF